MNVKMVLKNSITELMLIFLIDNRFVTYTNKSCYMGWYEGGNWAINEKSATINEQK
ncbi:hypothetical protein [Salipaludibacillus neizhouensis]|uniref:hypothetical protein n=1 Tax=Salipaludibacillus neizhouensis TaxID=885475 RepID=UPI001603463A|nr:hypothetical protein [Salipaludibacillus neizhouensis]